MLTNGEWFVASLIVLVCLTMIAMVIQSGISSVVNGLHEASPKSQPRPAQPAAQRAQPSAQPAPDYGAWIDSLAPSLDWMRELNDMPDRNPHAAFVGPSGSGKSSLILAALSQRPGQIVITTYKSAQDDPWGGFPAVRAGVNPETYEPDYRPIGAAWVAVWREMNMRHADGARPRTPITLVIDELTTCLNKLSAIKPQEKLIDMWLTGRSVGIRVIVGDPTMNVRGWGIEGRGDVRESILFVRCNRDKSAQFFEWDAARNTAFNVRPFNTSDVPAIIAQPLDAGRLWVPSEVRSLAQPVAAGLYAAPTSPEPTAHERAAITRWFAADPSASRRSLARRLYRERGGQNEDYDGSGGAFVAVSSVLDGVSAETLLPGDAE